MKKRILLAFTVLILLGSSSTHANAIFGLSKCEKTKNQIVKYEKIERPLVKEWGTYGGKRAWNFTDYRNELRQKEWVQLVNLEVKMFGLALNNIDCFSETQKRFISQEYPLWKNHQATNRAFPNQTNGINRNGIYRVVVWESIYDQ